VPVSGTTSAAGPELLVELRRDGGGGPLRAQLEAGLRAAVRERRRAAGARRPSRRALARDLGVSRRLVVDAYAQLTAEGWLEARHGAGTYVAHGAAAADPPPPPAPARRPEYDFFPGAPDLAGFPRAAWLRALREALRDAPASALHYPDPRGVPELRRALAAHLARVRGVRADPERMIVTTGANQAFDLLARVLARRGARGVAVEWPSLPRHHDVFRASGLRVERVRVDHEGMRVEELLWLDVAAALVTPAHQAPLGVALAPARRAFLLEWEGLVIEDDYDAEFRYDRPPLGALQGLAPEHVAYVGSASKTLAPGLRLGWLVAPAEIATELAEAKALADMGSPVLGQLALARMLETAAYDRHLRAARRRYRARRDALAAALAVHVPGARLEGLAAGLHAVVRLPWPLPAGRLVEEAAARSVGVYPIALPHEHTDALVLGYAGLSEPAIEQGIRRLAEAFGILRRPSCRR
jgi:GntR family transcriptional regulator/MocR family aminotransferase